MMYQVIETEVNMPLVSGFILIWLGIGLCLFVLGVDARTFDFLCCRCFCLSCYLWVTLRIPFMNKVCYLQLFHL